MFYLWPKGEKYPSTGLLEESAVPDKCQLIAPASWYTNGFNMLYSPTAPSNS